MEKKRKTKQKSQKPKKGMSVRIYLYAFILLGVFIGGIVIGKYALKKNEAVPSDTVWRFTAPVATSVGPTIGEGIVKPRFPAMGGKQRVTVTVKDTAPVTAVSATVTTDTAESQTYTLLPGGGTSYNSDWTGEWIVNDTYNKTYLLTIKATSTNGTTTVEIPLK